MPLGRRSSFALIAVAICGCATIPTSIPSSNAHHGYAPGISENHPESVDPSSLEDLNARLTSLNRDGAWASRGYFTPAEHDELERWYAAYLRRRQFLLETVARADGSPEIFDDPYVAAIVRDFRAEQIDGDSLLVATFSNDAIAVRKLNETFRRSGIAGGTFDQLRQEVTDPNTIRYLLDETRVANDKTTPMRFASTAQGQHPRDASANQKCVRAHRRISELLQQQYPVLPNLTNNVRHLHAAQSLVRSGRGIHDAWLDTRSRVVTRVGRIKNPTTRPLQFTPEQKRQIHQALYPGDVLLTYRAGVASNLVIRGRFKHAIIYVGTVEERRRAGLPTEHIGITSASEGELFAEGIEPATPFRIDQGDVVESLAEGVIVNNLDEILDTRVNRMVVLRPLIRADERQDALLNVFSFVGNAYDFHFDFADASDLVCTELFYRSYNGKGHIHLPLTQRFGHQTLNADDIIREYLDADSQAFELVLLVDQAPSPHERFAQVVFGSDARYSLARLMDR